MNGDTKDSAAVALGWRGGKNSRNHLLTPEQLIELARKPAMARWAVSRKNQ
jgi:hypothetical protein